MIDPQPSGRRWGWPVLALLSLAALLAGAWWLASARPASTTSFLQQGASQPSPQHQRPSRPHPHPASLGAGEAPRRRPPLQTAAGEISPARPTRQAVLALSQASAPAGEAEAGPARLLAWQDARRQLPLRPWLPL